ISTKVFISSIGSDVSQRYALHKCLSYVTTQEQIEIIRPDEVTLMFNPDLHMQSRVAEALIGGNLAMLSNLTLEVADTINENNSYITLGNLKRMYDAIAERGGDLALARKMVATMRRLGAESYMQDYSEALIRAGDPEELRMTYEGLNNNSPDDFWRLLSLWRLAQLL